MQTLRRSHPHLVLVFVAVGVFVGCGGDDDDDTDAEPSSKCATASCTDGSGGAKDPASGGARATAGKSGSGGKSAGAGGQGSGGSTTVAPGTGGETALDAGSSLPRYDLVIDAPDNGASVSDKVTVSGRAPGFVTVEIWDETHQKPPLAQGEPNADGMFDLTVDVATLAPGMTTWTVHAWDAVPTQSASNTKTATIDLIIAAGTDPGMGPCTVKSCSGHGTCSVSGTSASCTCDPGLHAVGLECIPETSSSDEAPDPGDAYVPDGYTLVFNDEFTSAALDTDKWSTLGPWDVQFFEDSKQKQAFVPEAVTLSDGVLIFTADHANGAGNANGQPYTSGSVTTHETFTHGYFEARVKVPAGKGFWPAYWLTSADRWPPEWDIFEIIDNVIYGYPHPIKAGKCQFVEGAAGADSTYMIDNLYGSYHVYGFQWTATDTYWWVDGKLTEHYAVDAAAGANDPYWLNVSFQVGGDWPGDPDGSTPFPGHMDVDYMRVYQQQ